MRLFIAIEIPKDLKKELIELQTTLKDVFLGSWVGDKLHLTLKFLGEVEDKKANAIKDALNKIRFSEFEMSLKGLGAFPSEEHIRVLWVGADKGDEEAKEIQKSVETELEKLGFEKEHRDYTNHLTLCRVKRADKQIAKDVFKKYKNTEFGTFAVDTISLIKSTLTPKGPIYEPV